MFMIVLGASAGGLRAMAPILAALPTEIPAAVMVILHTSRSDDSNILLARLQRNSSLPCHLAGDEMPLRAGHLYVAPADYHTVVKDDRFLLGKGPPEGRWRPSIDTTMRSAAVAFDSRCIGIILTGMLDDGTVGMEAVKRCGGYTIIQDPNEADYPAMPLSVLQRVQPDATLPVAAIPQAILDYISTNPKQTPVPDDLRFETGLNERVATRIENLAVIGNRSLFSCPDCGGGLWEMKAGDLQRYRCHIGHTYTDRELLEEQKQHTESVLWVALRTMEEKHALLNTIATKENDQGLTVLAKEHRLRADELSAYIVRLKEMIFGLQENGND